MSYCPCCGGPGTSLGALGNLKHFRCRDCGAQFSKRARSRTGLFRSKHAKKDIGAEPDFYEFWQRNSAPKLEHA